MPSINVLDDITVNKIAAGEVVEKPMAVIKELVENSIDAKASSITVEIKNGGLDLMRITDNGCGIPADEIEKAFCRHATSKINKIEDLDTLISLGFRGEALASIASVAQVECISKTAAQMTGIRYEVNGSVEASKKEVGCPDGTTFVVKNLFYNTPARKKFLKSPTTEGSYISDLLEKLAMSHPDISFRYIYNGKQKFQTNGNGKLKDVIYQIYGRDITANIVPFTLENEYINVSGFIGKPIISKGNRTFMNYFVNGRYVKSPIIYRALEEGYDGFHMSHKYPFCVLLFEADSSKIDVNVHPSKMEVRFSEGDRIYSVLCRGIKEALRNTDIIPEQSLRAPAQKKRTQNSLKNMSDGHAVDRQAADRNTENGATESRFIENNAKDGALTGNTYAEYRNIENIAEDGTLKKNVYTEKSHTQNHAEDNNENRHDDKYSNAVKNMRAPEPFETNRIASLSNSNSVQNPVDEPVYTTKNTKNVQMSLFERDDMKYESAKDYRIIGCVFSTYWIVQYHDEMYIMDQHAAHEKILYERLVEKMRNHETMRQQVSPPVIITLDAIEAELVKNNMEVFTDAGFEIEPFGGNEYAVSSVPADLPHIASRDVLSDLIASLRKETAANSSETVFLEKLASMSCKAAVKGGRSISAAEAKQLVEDLFGLENPFNCPHGRPTLIRMTKYELEKRFGRQL